MTEDSLAVDPSAPSDVDESAELRSPRFPDLVDLFTRPRWFFGKRLLLKSRPYVLVAIYVSGFTSFINRLDYQLLKSQYAGSAADPIFEIAGFPWPALWMAGSVVAVIFGTVIYWLGGWWYGVRVLLSGAESFETWSEPRVIMLWASLVSNLPVFLLMIGYTVFYPNYLAAFQSDEVFSALTIIPLFWSCAVSYIAVRENFDVKPWQAQIWFLYLPALTYVVILGGATVLASMFL